MHPNDIVKTACGQNIVKLGMPLQAQYARVRALKSLYILLSLQIINNNSSIEQAERKDVLLVWVPTETSTGICSWNSHQIIEIHIFNVEFLYQNFPLRGTDRQLPIRVPVQSEYYLVGLGDL